MRRARINYSDAYYHLMSRGYEGRNIFQNLRDKLKFLQLLSKFGKRNNIEFLAWCILDNHYHLIIINKGNNLSKFMKELNGSFGSWYRKKYGGKGVVFDGRFKSSVIENEEYLVSALLYLYNNPVRAGIVNKCKEYEWSSFKELLFHSKTNLTNTQYLNDNIIDLGCIEQLLLLTSNDRYNPISNRWGETLGSNVFRFHSLLKNNRRKSNDDFAPEKRSVYKKVKKSGDIVKEFLFKHKLFMKDLTGKNRKSSKYRGMLIVILRDEYGYKLKEIHKLIPFSQYSYNSLGRIYKNAVERNL